MDLWFYDELPIQAYQKFLSRPWWYRVWVIQEVSVAKEAIFVCGSKRVRSECLGIASNILFLFRTPALGRTGASKNVWNKEAKRKHDLNMQIGAAFYGMDMMMGFRSRNIRGLDDLCALLALLMQTAGVNELGAMNDRDRIFALLGLASDGRPRNFN